MDNGRVWRVRAPSMLGWLENYLAFQRELSHVSKMYVQNRDQGR